MLEDSSEHFEQQKRTLNSQLEKSLKKAHKRIDERRLILENCKNWQTVHHEGLLLQANLFRMSKGMLEITVSDWEEEGKERVLSLIPRVSPQDQVKAYFRRSKKLRLGQPHAERLLLQAEKELTVLSMQYATLQSANDACSLKKYLEQYQRVNTQAPIKKPSQKKEVAKPYHRFVSQAGVEIWVGKSARDNDKLSFQYAKGLDYWLHARDHPGSHVIIRCLKDHMLDEASLHDAAELALRYSKAKEDREGEVCVTHVNAIRSVKGVPGKVTLSKYKTLRIVLDDSRWNRLKNKT
jgi:predicted ribosome quality control (RQC) complex YloA/Tae2 family protein